MEDYKDELRERFARLYGEEATLHCVHLDGFSHDVFWKDADGNKHVDGYSAYAPEIHEKPHVCYTRDGSDWAYKSFNDDRTKAFFLGYGHAWYQHNAQEIIFADVRTW